MSAVSSKACSVSPGLTQIEQLIREITRRQSVVSGPACAELHVVKVALQAAAKALRLEERTAAPAPLAEARAVVMRDLVPDLRRTLRTEALGGQRERIQTWLGNVERVGRLLRDADLDGRSARAGDVDLDAA